MPDPHERELVALTGLRAVAAWWVVALHLFGPLAADGPLAGLLHGGNLAVDLFFVLSGFVLAYRWADAFREPSRRAWASFLRRRLARIYPLHVATIGALLLGLAIGDAAGVAVPAADRLTAAGLVANLLLVQAWRGTDPLSWNQVAWSLSAEWAAYLAFPLLAWLLAPARRSRALLPAAVVILALEPLVLLAFGSTPLARVGTAFSAGVLLALAVRRGGEAAWRWDVVAPVCAVLFVAGTALLPANGVQWLLLALTAPLIVGLAHGRGALAGALASPPARFWGGASYALYLTHALVLGRLPAPAGDGAAPLAFALLDLGAVALVAAGAHRLVEAPLRAMLAGPPFAPAAGRTRGSHEGGSA